MALNFYYIKKTKGFKLKKKDIFKKKKKKLTYKSIRKKLFLVGKDVFYFLSFIFFYKLIYIIKELSKHFVYPLLKKRLFNLIYKGNPIRNDLYHKKSFFFLLFTIIHERYFKDLEIDLNLLYLSFFLKKYINFNFRNLFQFREKI